MTAENADVCKLFVEYAQKDVRRWEEVVGTTAEHISPDRGLGTIVSVDNSLGFITVTVDYQDGRHRVLGRSFCENHSALYLAKKLQQALPVLVERERDKKKLIAELFDKFHIKNQTSTPLNTLIRILLTIHEGRILTEDDIGYLESKKYFKALAIYFSDRYKATGDCWKLSKASKYCRDADLPQDAIDLTAGIEHFSCNAKARSAVTTSRGAAFADIDEYEEAERCANAAINIEESYYAYNLLGRIFYKQTKLEEGDKAFERAVALGSELTMQDTIIRDTIKSQAPEIRGKIFRYLKQKDQKRFQWVNKYI